VFKVVSIDRYHQFYLIVDLSSSTCLF